MTAGPDDIGYQQHGPLFGGFSESDLVEKPAIDLFAQLGWTTGNLFGEFAHGASAQGRASKRDAILPNRLKAALKRLNPSLPDGALDDAYTAITHDRGAIDPIRANAEVHALIRNGVPVEVRGKDGERKTEIVRDIAWDNTPANDFFLASQVWFAGELYTKRADLVGFVNGLPLLFVELKASHKAMADAYDGNLSDYRTTMPQVFAPNAFVILSNGLEAVLGAPYAPLEFFAEWKRIDDEEEAGVVSLDTLIRGTCRPVRFLDLVENFIAFEEEKLKREKFILDWRLKENAKADVRETIRGRSTISSRRSTRASCGRTKSSGPMCSSMITLALLR